MKTILIVEDDDDTAEVLTLAIGLETTYQVLRAKTGEQALEMVRQTKPGHFILDYLLPHHMNGIALYDHLLTLEGLEAVPTMILTAYNHDIEQLQEAIQARHLLSLAKPFDLDALLETIERALMSSPAYCTQQE